MRHRADSAGDGLQAPARLPVLALVLGSVLVWLARIQWPQPRAGDPDASAQLVLGYAYQQGRQFGPRIIFTHGPWSFLKLVYCYPLISGRSLSGELFFTQWSPVASASSLRDSTSGGLFCSSPVARSCYRYSRT